MSTLMIIIVTVIATLLVTGIAALLYIKRLSNELDREIWGDDGEDLSQ